MRRRLLLLLIDAALENVACIVDDQAQTLPPEEEREPVSSGIIIDAAFAQARDAALAQGGQHECRIHPESFGEKRGIDAEFTARNVDAAHGAIAGAWSNELR